MIAAGRSGAGSSRLDQALVERGLAPTRAKARALILAGRVFAGSDRLDKPGCRVRAETPLRVQDGPRYVGRGAYKLAGALENLGVDLQGVDAMDVGSSTGGFTQVLLAAGVRRVLAVDVGRGQLDWSLRSDSRVLVLEGVNARYLVPEQLPFRPHLAVIDVSFISLERVLEPVARCLTPPGRILALAKPQFEVGRGRVGRGGIVREPELHREVLERLVGFCTDRGWGVAGVSVSPLRGAEGNVEFFLHLIPGDPGSGDFDVAAAVRDAVREGVEGGGDPNGV